MSYQILIRNFSLHKKLCNRVPLIKFRAGKHSTPAPARTPSTPSASPGQQAGGKVSAAQTGPVIDDYMLPARYRRAPIDDYEIEYINRGGPD